MGGLSRRYTAIRKIKGNESIDHLLVDSGNFLFSSPKTLNGKNKATLTAMGIAKVYHEMNYDAVNIGPNDLAAGIGFLKSIDFLPWVCANFYDNSGETIFTPYIVKSDRQQKYGIIGLSPQPLSTSAEYSYRSWRTILEPLIQELKSKVDCILLLSSLNEKENHAIAQKFPDIRLIFSSHHTSGNVPPRIVNKAIITQTANRGRYLGQLYLLNPGIYDWVDTSTLSSATLKKQKKALEYRLSRVDYLLNRDGNTPETVASLEKQKAIILKQIKADDHENSQQTHTPKSTFKAAFSPLTQNIGEDRRINEMIKEIKKGAESFTN